MKYTYDEIKITAVYSFLPENVIDFDDEVKDAMSPRNQSIKRSMGYGKRGRTKHGTTTIDMYVYALNYVIENKIVLPDEIGAIIVACFTPSYFVPQIGDTIKYRLNLPNDIYSIDIWDGCNGYLSGMLEAAIILRNIAKSKKVILLTGDTYNHLSENDEAPMIDFIKFGGDAASVTVFEKGTKDDRIPILLKSHGSHIMKKVGGAFSDFYFEKVINPEILMDKPNEVFRFFQNAIPECINELLDYTNTSISEVEGFSVIQANSFAVYKYAESLGIDYEKMPNDLVGRYGDVSATINPIALVELLERLDDNKPHKLMVVGYGAGLRYGAALIDTDPDLKYGLIKTPL